MAAAFEVQRDKAGKRAFYWGITKGLQLQNQAIKKAGLGRFDFLSALSLALEAAAMPSGLTRG